MNIFLKMPLHTLLKLPLFRGGVYDLSAWIWTLGLLPNRTWIKWAMPGSGFGPEETATYCPPGLLLIEPSHHAVRKPRPHEAVTGRSWACWSQPQLRSQPVTAINQQTSPVPTSRVTDDLSCMRGSKEEVLRSSPSRRRVNKRILVILSHLVWGYSAVDNWHSVEEELESFCIVTKSETKAVCRKLLSV